MRKVKYRLSILVMVFFISCGNNSNNSTVGDKNATVPPASPKNYRLNRFDDLENIFQNENWIMINGKDSSYLYCSRLGKTYFKAYQYRMFKGDSISTRITEIKLTADTIIWQSLKDSMIIYLNKVTPREAVWSDKAGLQFYIFDKVDSNNIHVTYPDGSAKSLVKTPTLSSFLVRSKYDYLHGTKLAFSKDK